jgi:hypothetical protein
MQRAEPQRMRETALGLSVWAGGSTKEIQSSQTRRKPRASRPSSPRSASGAAKEPSRSAADLVGEAAR